MIFFVAVSVVFSIIVLIISTSAIYPKRKKLSRMRQGLLMLAIGFSSASQFFSIYFGPSQGDQAAQTVRIWAQYLTASAGILAVLYGLHLLLTNSKRGAEKVDG